MCLITISNLYFIFQQICQQLHSLWSAPFRIVIAVVLLYMQLGIASLVGALMLVLLFPIQVHFLLRTLLFTYISNIIILTFVCLLEQTLVISRMQKLTKEGLQRTDKRIGLMNEVLAAMDTVKYVYISHSFICFFCLLNAFFSQTNNIELLTKRTLHFFPYWNTPHKKRNNNNNK
jgi:hypothetical protein